MTRLTFISKPSGWRWNFRINFWPFLSSPFHKKISRCADSETFPLEKATMGFEPMIKVLQTSALPLGYVAIIAKS